MFDEVEDTRYCEYLFRQFYGIGSTASGGVTRLGYSETEDEMHNKMIELGAELGCGFSVDEVGNTYISNTDSDNYYLLGSHLDSVIEGGRYDGVAGIIAGLMVLRWIKVNNLDIPLKVVAFRCEESSNFGCCTIGSGLITKEIYKRDIDGILSKEGRMLGDIFKERGLSLHPNQISGMKEYIELHIEQGKVLEECNTQLGIVSTIAGPRRYYLYFHGMAEHSGTTPMMMRNDALCAAAELILEVERVGRKESVYQSVATVGVIDNSPNALNVIPGEVKLGIDMRGIDNASLDRMEDTVLAAARRIAKQREIKLIEEKISNIPPIDMSKKVQAGLEKAAKNLGISNRVMISGAGHDAMSMAPLCDTGMLFIPCKKGISHNKIEFATIKSICDGAKVLYEYIVEDDRENGNDFN